MYYELHTVEKTTESKIEVIVKEDEICVYEEYVKGYSCVDGIRKREIVKNSMTFDRKHWEAINQIIAIDDLNEQENKKVA